jgi:hypothetical protein
MILVHESALFFMCVSSNFGRKNVMFSLCKHANTYSLVQTPAANPTAYAGPLELLAGFSLIKCVQKPRMTRHSAKTILHSAKALPSVTLGKEHSAKISSAKGSLPSAFFRTLGKDFAECQKALGKEKHSAN